MRLQSPRRVIPSYDTNDGTSVIHSSSFRETSLSNPSADQSVLVPQPNYDEATVIYVERLLLAVDRLRGERDNLRRDIQFLESESKFAIEALEAKLSASMSSVCDESVTTIAQMKAEMDGLYAQLSEMNQRQLAVVGRKNEEMRRLALAATASLLIVARLSSCNDHLQHRLDEARTVVTNAEQGLIYGGEACFESKTRFQELENKFHAVVLCLEATTRQRDDLKAELETKDHVWQEEFGAVELAQQERGDKLEEVICQLTDLTKQLEDVESERDSLTLQVTNLMTDLATAQQELANAESRYSSLQFHQLSTMTSNEANRALRDQIEELEMRVMRRTEQIGVHQHDIRRLETNLRLQEERLAEMTMELEMLAAQKDAMVEDCADAREARDRALSQGEALEEEMENMEVRLQEEEESVRRLIGVVFETVSKARQTILRSETRSRDFKDDQKQLTIALAVSQVEQAGVADYIDRIRHENAQLNLWTTSLEDQLRIKDADVTSLSSDLDLAIQESSRLASEFAVRSSELEAEIRRLQTIISTQEKGRQVALSDLHNHEDVQKCMQEGESPNNNRDSSSQQQANEIVPLQLRLADANMALTELRSLKHSSESNNQKAILEATNGRSQHETQIGATQDEPLAIRERAEELKEHYEEICSLLRIELEQMARKATDLQEIQLKLQLENERVCAQLTLVQQENITAAVQAHDRLSLTLTQLEGQKAQLQEELEEATYQLEKSTQQTAQLSRQLQDDKDKFNSDREQHVAQMLVMTERQQKADAELLRAEEDLEILNEKLVQAELHCRSVEDEKLVFLEQITTMKAEIQRLLSLTRFLENQVKERCVCEVIVYSAYSRVMTVNMLESHSVRPWNVLDPNWRDLRNQGTPRWSILLFRALSTSAKWRI
jgi:chromosome segregation ATPase